MRPARPGKWTTYRLMAEKTIDRVQRFLGLEAEGCRTRACRLSGSDGVEPTEAPTTNAPELGGSVA
jgi:glycerol-3-phosphate dehydrogenase